jgi:hypothetical protein
MEDKIPLIKAPTLILAGTEDPFSYPHAKRLARRIKGSETVEIKGGMVPMVDQMPEAFAGAVIAFLASDRSGGATQNGWNGGKSMKKLKVGCGKPTGAKVGEKATEEPKNHEPQMEKEVRMDIVRVGQKAPVSKCGVDSSSILTVWFRPSRS